MRDAHSAIFAEASLDLKFRSQGYVIVPFLNRREIDSLQKLYEATVPESIAPFYVTIHDADVGRQRRVSAQIETILAPRAAALIPTYPSLLSGFIVKRGGAAHKVDLHQDYTLVDGSLHTAVRLWCPLTDVDETNGCLKVVPGSHRLVRHIAAAVTVKETDQRTATSQLPRARSNPSPYDSVTDILAAEYARSLPMAAGEAFLFDGGLLHASDSNNSSEARISVTSSYLPEGVRPRLYTWDPMAPGRLEVLEFLDPFEVRLGLPVPDPFPEGFTSLGSLEYRPVPLTEREIERLRETGPAPGARVPVKVAAFMAKSKGPGWISRMLGK